MSTYASAWRPAVPLRAEVVRKKLLQIERGLQIAAEALFEAGNHVLTAEFRESVDRY